MSLITEKPATTSPTGAREDGTCDGVCQRRSQICFPVYLPVAKTPTRLRLRELVITQGSLHESPLGVQDARVARLELKL